MSSRNRRDVRPALQRRRYDPLLRRRRPPPPWRRGTGITWRNLRLDHFKTLGAGLGFRLQTILPSQSTAWPNIPQPQTPGYTGPHDRLQLGAGRIFPIDEAEIIVEPFQFPPWYRQVYALDVGWNRTAALWGALDPENDVLYLTSEHYRSQAEPPIHAAAIKARGDWQPGVIDPAARGRSQHDGEQLIAIYRGLGLSLVTADNAVEAGIYAVWDRLSTGRIKVFRPLQNFLAEYRLYRRDEKGKVVKDNDRLIDCLRYMVMSGITLAREMPADLARARGLPPYMRQEPRHEYEHDPFTEMDGDRKPHGRRSRHQAEHNPFAAERDPWQHGNRHG